MSDQPANIRNELMPDLTDDDVYDAMGRLPGYLDITTDDFRALYRLASDHAMERLVGSLRARDLMRPAGAVVRPEQTLDRAADLMSTDRIKSSPVIDEQGIVVGVLSETDFLCRLGVNTVLGLILQWEARRADLDHLLESTIVREIMVSPAVTVSQDSDYESMLSAFRSHRGRRMPVVDKAGKLLGILVRKDFLAAYPLGFGGQYTRSNPDERQDL